MNVFEAYIVCEADIRRTARMQGIAEGTVRRRLANLGVSKIGRGLHRQAATIGRAAGRLFAELYAKADSGRTVADIQRTIIRDYPDLSANALKELEANIKDAKSAKALNRRKAQLELHLSREAF